MQNNYTLNKAKHSNNTDEWYTEYKTVEKELKHYKKQFYNKIVLCNCDDPFESSFARYFINNFNDLNLKKLICTSYAKSILHTTIYEDNDEYGYVLIVDEVKHTNVEKLDDKEIVEYIQENFYINNLNGDGDFRSEECVEFLKESDIVVTNPPFSMFLEIFSLVMRYEKKFLFIANQNAITYKDIFPYIKENVIRVGHHFGDMAFKVPSHTKPRKTRFWVDKYGQKWRSLGNAMWLTNLQVLKQYKGIEYKCSFNEKIHERYDNYNAIHILRVSEIPCDYYGIMGVPVTYLKYHDEEQFEIVGEANHGSDNEYDLFRPIVNGKEKFKRILIKRIRR